MKKCPRCGKEYEQPITLCPSDGAVLHQAGDDLIGQILAEKYRVEEFINEGGMGAVYRGTHVLMDKTVAIKILHPALAADDKIVARFSREARAASRISHPHALNVTDFGESSNGIVYLVMEYLRGETLKEVIRTGGPMPLSRVIEIIRQVSGALDVAHAEGVVHRDLKSDNIMLVEGVGSDWAKVLDFGIAKIQEPVGQDQALTSPNLIIGTPQYMSPEQCSQASEIDARTDIYSLGVILYEMLVGHVPFTGESPTAIMMKHLQDPPPSVLADRNDLPEAIDRIIATAMAKRPEDRYQTAGELAQSLALAAETETPAGAVATANAGNADRSTERIIVPTDPNFAPRETDSPDDESTVIRSRPAGAAVVGAKTVRSEPASGLESFNPWRIAVPALVGLVVLFGVVFFLTRGSSQPAANQEAPPPTIERNSRPVQPAPPPTGRSEQTITSKIPVASPSASPIVNATPASNQNRERPRGETTGGANSNRRRSGETNDNAGADDEDMSPSPTPAPRNTNRSNRNSNRSREAPSPQATPYQVNPENDAESGRSGPPVPKKAPSASPSPRKTPPLPKPTEPSEPPPPLPNSPE